MSSLGYTTCIQKVNNICLVVLAIVPICLKRESWFCTHPNTYTLHTNTAGLPDATDGAESPGSISMNPFTRKRNSETSIAEWITFLRYSFLSPVTATRSRHRSAQRQNVACPVKEIPDEKSWDSSDILPPVVGPQMTAVDLFALEMWHLPIVCPKEFSDQATARQLWEAFLTTEQRTCWETAVRIYISLRERPGPLSFEAVQPWWLSAQLNPTVLSLPSGVCACGTN